MKNSLSSPSSSFQSKRCRLILGRAIGSSPFDSKLSLTTFWRYLGPFLTQDLFAETLKHNRAKMDIHLGAKTTRCRWILSRSSNRKSISLNKQSPERVGQKIHVVARLGINKAMSIVTIALQHMDAFAANAYRTASSSWGYGTVWATRNARGKRRLPKLRRTIPRVFQLPQH